MWSLAERLVKAVSDVMVGTVIVLVHVTLADRERDKKGFMVSVLSRVPS
jgi:hypothetical protein